MGPRRHDVVVLTPPLDANGNPEQDGRGRPKPADPVPSKADIEYTSTTVRDRQGVERKSTVTIELPPDVYINHLTKIEFTNSFGRKDTVSLVTFDEALNLSGSRVLCRMAYCG